MLRILTFIITGALLFSCNPTSYQVSGSIMNKSASPVNGRVEFYKVSDRPPYLLSMSALSQDGKFSTRLLEAGKYKVIFIPHDQASDITFGRSARLAKEAEEFDVQAGTTVIDIEVQPLTETKNGTGVVTGTVTDRRGNPVAGIPIKTRLINGEFTGSVITDNRGQYLIQGLPVTPEGTDYVVSLEMPGLESANCTVSIRTEAARASVSFVVGDDARVNCQ